MGSAIARTFVDRGYRTTVWNRTTSKSAPLADAGATAATEAVAASPLVVVCLLDGAAVDEVPASVPGRRPIRPRRTAWSGRPRQGWTPVRPAGRTRCAGRR
ncbi:NAD(P)-binding domain-containing protein [Streptosporangium fragile]|uniref:NAD(P)-binding domain-containing protein n=1 Tax=Streptosporangium fragile TaxID=46186 RepID=UPI0031ED0636